MATPGVHPADEVVPTSAPRPRAGDGELLQPYYVWDLVVRLTHWIIMLSMILLAVTGVYIGRPWSAPSGPATQHFLTGWVRVLHFYGAIVFSLAVLSRIAWMLVGPRRSNWRQFIPTSKRRLRDLKETFRFYTFFRDRPPRTLGHNPLAGASYIAVFGLYVVMIASGLALYSISSHSYMQLFQFLLPLFHGAQWARWIHHVTMWLLIGFVVHHVYSAMLTSRVEKNGTIDSMFSGYKFLPKDMPHDDE